MPYKSEDDKGSAIPQGRIITRRYGVGYTNDLTNIELNKSEWKEGMKGRFPANLLVSDDVLDGDSFSRYFDLDKWSVEQVKVLPEGIRKTFPFLLVPKASKSERNKGLKGMVLGESPASGSSKPTEGRKNALGNPRENFHPTVKPLKLMSYLLTLGSQENDVVLDPFCGSGSTCIAAEKLNRKWIGIEISSKYCEIAENRLKPWINQTRLSVFNDE
ncbi:hypothetical protein CL614_04040 [archaeon]|nr:hypothetical protein [archaeon]